MKLYQKNKYKRIIFDMTESEFKTLVVLYERGLDECGFLPASASKLRKDFEKYLVEIERAKKLPKGIET